MTDTITTVGLYQHKTEVTTGTVYLYRMVSCKMARNRTLVSSETYTSKKERTFIMLQMRLDNDTFNKTGYYFLLKPDDKN